MKDYPLYLLGVLILFLLHRAWPRPRLGFVLLFWWLGVILLRLSPPFLATVMSGGPGLSVAARLTTGAGAVLLLRALDVLTFWDRPRTRWTMIAKWAMVGGLLLGGVGGGAIGLLAVPWLVSFRWRKDLSAGPLFVANITGLVSFILMVIVFGSQPDPDRTELMGIKNLADFSAGLGLVYAILVIPATATRIHLSIRRIGTRLVGSHVLASVIPFVLASLFLLLSAALFLSTYRGSIGTRYLQQMSRDMRKALLGALATGADPAPPDPGAVLLIREDDLPARVLGGPSPIDPDSILNAEVDSRSAPLYWDRERLYVRSRIDTVLAGRRIRIEALRQVDSLDLARASSIAGVAIRVDPKLSVLRRGGGVQIGVNEGVAAGAEDSARSASIGPRGEGKGRLPGGSIIGCLVRDAGGWKTNSILVSSSAAFGEPLLALFTNTRENPLSTVVLVVLAVIAIFFIGAIWVTVTMVLDMGRSITRAVRALTTATAALRAGDLQHRIALVGNDELWNVAASFNDMADGLVRMRSMELEAQRLDEELRLAREIQNRLLPSGPPANEYAELAGISLPAREIGGDYFDYIALEDGRVGIAVADVSGKGTPAALLMSTFRAALRSQDLGLLGPAEVLGRINRFIHSSVDPGKFITAFLCLFDPRSGEIRYANAGHDPPLLIAKGGAVTELTGGGLILGLLPQIAYEEAKAQIPSESLIAIFTDGVTEAQNPDGEFFGAEGLTEVLCRHSTESCSTLLQRSVDAINRFADTRAQFDDITLVLARRN